MAPSRSPDYRPLMFISSLLLFMGSTWGAKWAVVTATGLILCWGWWVVGTLRA
jgi:hypothetical protein